MDDYLRRALSLSSAGGIYFDGARVDSDPRQKTLFIGLGGSGADALIRVKNQVANRMRLPVDPDTHLPTADVPDNIAFLAFDTDRETENIQCGNTKLKPNGQEFCPITVPDVAGVIVSAKRQKEQGAEEYQWVHDDLTGSGGENGANSTRQVGRLLLFQNIDTIVSRLRETMARLTANNGAASELQIIIFSGISGGTGAGTFLDMGYICRQVAGASPCSILGYFILPDVNDLKGGETKKNHTNGFACLKELDFLLQEGMSDRPFHQKYNSNFTVDTIKAPYSYCHLVNASNGNHRFTYNDILNSLAENVFSYVAGETTGAEPAMKSLYNNIGQHMAAISANVMYPANYRYLSVGAATLQIPYTEITTLLACRMFLQLEKSVFANRPTRLSINDDLSQMGYSENQFIHFLMQGTTDIQNLTRPDFTGYKYDDVWGDEDRAFKAAHVYLVQYQQTITWNAGKFLGYFEGQFRDFIKAQITNPERGPIYLAHLVSSNEASNLMKWFEKQKERYNDIAKDRVEVDRNLENEKNSAYTDGKKVGFWKRKTALSDYLEKLDLWLKNQEEGYLASKLFDLAKELMERIKVYYNRILKPLADTLNQMPVIFRENLTFLEVAYDEAKRNPDPSMLIYPLQFEARYQAQFRECTENAIRMFLDAVSGNLTFWIGREVDDVDRAIASGENIAGFLAHFISEVFNPLYQQLSMEMIMDTLRGRQTLEEFVQARVRDLFDTSYAMYNERAGLHTPVNEFTFLSLPRTDARLLQAAQNYVADAGIANVTEKRSSEINRMYVVKVTAGYPVYSNYHIGAWEKDYEEYLNNLDIGCGVHLYPEWGDHKEENDDTLPSPNIEPAWNDTYRDESTHIFNERVKSYFDHCYKGGIILESSDPTKKEAFLLLADESIDLDHLVLRGTTEEKMRRLEGVASQLWDTEINDAQHRLKLSGTGSLYTNEGPNALGMSGNLQNVRENCTRFPYIKAALRKQCGLMEKVNRLRDELETPALYARALLCELLPVDPATRDMMLVRYATDPLPIRLVRGFEYDLKNDYSAHFTIYRKFYDAIDASGDDWRHKIIPDMLRNRMKLNHANPEEGAEFKRTAEEYEAKFKELADVAYEKELRGHGDMRAIVALYHAIAEECARLAV